MDFGQEAQVDSGETENLQPECIGEEEECQSTFRYLHWRLLKMSQSKVWECARAEWALESIEFKKNGECLCGHHPITERCHIYNRLTEKSTVLGNCCIEEINADMHKLSTSAFRSLSALIHDPDTRRANDSLLFLAEQKHVASRKAFEIYHACKAKRVRISPAQKKVLLDVNRKIVAAFGE